MLTLYQFEDCPCCRAVRQKLSDMEMTYISVCVSPQHRERAAVLRVTGRTQVPVLVDEDTVLTDDQDIIPYLERNYARGGARRMRRSAGLG